MKLVQILKYLDDFFNISNFSSSDPSQNGLQVESSDEITKIGTAVDACMESFEGAANEKVDLLIVHHGLFWGKSLTITSMHGKRISYLIKNNISLYALHLPLDMHIKLGNNAQIAQMLSLEVDKPFGDYHNLQIGVQSTYKTPVPFENVVKKVEEIFKTKSFLLNFGPQKIKKIAIVSGGGASEITLAAKKKMDLLITGEIGHGDYHIAKELGINVIDRKSVV